MNCLPGGAPAGHSYSEGLVFSIFPSFLSQPWSRRSGSLPARSHFCPSWARCLVAFIPSGALFLSCPQRSFLVAERRLSLFVSSCGEAFRCHLGFMATSPVLPAPWHCSEVDPSSIGRGALDVLASSSDRRSSGSRRSLSEPAADFYSYESWSCCTESVFSAVS